MAKATKTLTIAIMDPPYETASTTTALRIVDAALRKGNNVHVFAYEGAVNLTMAAQKPHANPLKGTSAEPEEHPTTKDWIASLFAMSRKNGAKLEWINCGLCVDERGAGDWIAGPRRGAPKDFYEAAQKSDTTLVIPAK
ncbi:MAG: DsrE family protein [Betaproteobacteria bacterium]|nr:DsrE family protein [Betaproteobacteria bacterium]